MGGGEGGFSKNHIPRRIHKERAQLSGRVSKHGLLEKKRDYKLRARDANRKAKRLRILKEKARFRNTDEFYYGMINQRTNGGVLRRKENKDAIPLQHQTRDQRLLTETQDSNYMAYKLSVERGKIQSLKVHTHFVGDGEEEGSTKGKGPKHIVFADDDEEKEEVTKRLMSRRKKSRSVVNVNRGEDEGGQGGDEEEEGDELDEPLNLQSQKASKQLEKRRARYNQLSRVFNDMSLQKKLLSKGARVLEKPGNKKTGAPPVFRWLQERKR